MGSIPHSARSDASFGYTSRPKPSVHVHDYWSENSIKNTPPFSGPVSIAGVLVKALDGYLYHYNGFLCAKKTCVLFDDAPERERERERVTTLGLSRVFVSEFCSSRSLFPIFFCKFVCFKTLKRIGSDRPRIMTSLRREDQRPRPCSPQPLPTIPSSAGSAVWKTT